MKSSTRKIFLSSFVSGLAAPVLLFSDFSSPEVKKAGRCLPGATNDAMNALAGDWRKIGGDIKVAMSKHGKAA